MAKKSDPSRRAVAVNRKARHNYFIEDTIEAGIVLSGPEVKSLRAGQVSIAEAFAGEKAGELYLMNAHIKPYGPARQENVNPYRARKLLLHRREMARLMGKQQRAGNALVPLSLYFNDRGIAKVELALARGKRKYDKRQSAKTKDWERQKARLMREKG